MLNNYLKYWYSLRIRYYKMLLDGCLDEQLRQELIEKIKQYSDKLNALLIKKQKDCPLAPTKTSKKKTILHFLK
ncbi:hypothetical protein JOC85_002454 [Bacillus mesophilus]|nr:hypothetical protein [Bacillus mesophilus]